MAYYRLEPFGEHRSDLRMGILASIIANVNRDRKRKSSPFKAEDFIPDFGGEYTAEANAMTPDETLDLVRQMHERLKSMEESGLLTGNG